MRIITPLMLALALTACQQASINSTSTVGKGNSWDDFASLPDFTAGVWEPQDRMVSGDRKFPEGIVQNPYTFMKTPTFTLAGQKAFDHIKSIGEAGGDVPSRSKACIHSFAGSMSGPETLFAFAYAPGKVLIYESHGTHRLIETDGSKLPEDPDETLQGISIGHWDGNTLVIETIGLDARNEIIYGVSGGKNMRVDERMSLADPNTLQIETSLKAPEMIAGSWDRTQKYTRHTDFKMLPFECTQNQRDTDASGKQTFDLTPP